MVRIKVKYLNVYKHIIHRNEDIFELQEPVTLEGLLNKVNQNSTLEFRKFVLDENHRLKSHVWILVRGQRTRNLQKTLKDGDVVVFSLPLVGG